MSVARTRLADLMGISDGERQRAVYLESIKECTDAGDLVRACLYRHHFTIQLDAELDEALDECARTLNDDPSRLEWEAIMQCVPHGSPLYERALRGHAKVLQEASQTAM